MKQVAVIYGGKSVEHEVSIITGLQVIEAINKTLFKVTPIYIDKDGDWFHGKTLTNINIYKKWNKKQAKQFNPTLEKSKKNFLAQFDIAVLACHGNYGEDGKLQGLLDFLDIPYTSSGVTGSSAGMDKIVMKNIFLGITLPVLPFIWFSREDWLNTPDEIVKKVHYTLDYPVFVKPANLGSSIGISLAKNEKELRHAIEIASRYDYRILVEKGLEPCTEANCSAFMYNGEILTSPIEEPLRWETFLSFENKYISSNNKSAGMKSMKRKVPADLPKDIQKNIENYTRLIYKNMDLNGVIRVDYLLSEDKEQLFVNEVNTIPGSFCFYLWEHNNISFEELITKNIEETLRQQKIKKDKILRYDSTILENISKSGPKTCK